MSQRTTSSRYVPPTPHTKPPAYGNRSSYNTPASPPYSPPSELLPSYSPAVELFGTCLWKNEYLTPFNESNKRSWDLVVLEVNSTQVNVYQITSISRKLRSCIFGLFFELNKIGLQQNHQYPNSVPTQHQQQQTNASCDSDDIYDEEDLSYDDAWGNSGEDSTNGDSLALKLRAKLYKYKHHAQLNKLDMFYKSDLSDNKLLLEPTLDRSRFEKFQKDYTLKLIGSFTFHQMALGIAPNIHSCKMTDNATHNLIDSITHVKYTNTLRIRLETRQALIQCWSFHALVQWYRAFIVGRDLASPIETRALSKFKSIPTRSNLLLNATIVEAHIGSRYSEKIEQPREQPQAGTTSTSATPNISSGRGRAESTSDGSIATSDVSSVASSASIFDDEATSMNTLPTNVDEGGVSSYCVTINKMQFVNYESKYTCLEKQYIESCLGELKMFENWSKKCLTILSVNLFYEFCTPFADDDALLFISHSVLDTNVTLLERRMLQDPNKTRMCRSFVVDRSGLVSVVRTF
ncbi:uncharacterized protein KQ657_004156 [Scheffersomyces spartinae]|uniref:Uncharacterized protein n=1 Tax=Scheffersomyces spartinae TaxID=45513 RepID=A0A9P8AJ32_9ASCO|nr:uncharacterized protein KQ657_004156 [Scheffersomyces spartinae]KAG7195043.1 hypothetical protein KQ657_004156 [Scheffersomyces spartinae]